MLWSLSNIDSGDAPSIPSRAESLYNPLHTFELPKGIEKNYAHQFADMYFLRLAQLKTAVMQKAQEAWEDFEVRSMSSRGLNTPG
jgi:DNA polymerase delta subunit 2